MDGMMEKARRAGIDDAAIALLDDRMNARAAVGALLDGGRAPMALRLLVCSMPRGYVVPWLCECARSGSLSERDAQGVRLAGRWLRERDEASRRATLAHAQEHAYASAGALIAASAGWSEGWLLDARGNEVTPVGPHMMAVAATGALLMLAAEREEPGMEASCAAFVREGVHLLCDGGAR